MIADIDYGRCRTCGGPLQILDANSSTAVTCVECADSYDLDTDTADDWPRTDDFPLSVPHWEAGGDAWSPRTRSNAPDR